MDATTTFPTRFSRPQPRPATATIPRRGGRARVRIAAIALMVALLAALILGMVDGAAGRPLGDPGPAIGPGAGLVGLLLIAPPG